MFTPIFVQVKAQKVTLIPSRHPQAQKYIKNCTLHQDHNDCACAAKLLVVPMWKII